MGTFRTESTRYTKMKFTRPPVVGLSYSNKSNGPQKENSNVYDIEIKPCIILDNNLKLLELVNRFELCIDMNKLDKYSLNFLQELEKIKYTTQKKTIHAINYCKSQV